VGYNAQIQNKRFTSVARQRIAKAFPLRLQSKRDYTDWFINNAEAEILTYLAVKTDYFAETKERRKQLSIVNKYVIKLRRITAKIIDSLDAQGVKSRFDEIGKFRENLGLGGDANAQLAQMYWDTTLYRLAWSADRNAETWQKLWLRKGRPPAPTVGLANALEHLYVMVAGSGHGFASVLKAIKHTDLVKNHQELQQLSVAGNRKRRQRTKSRANAR